MSQPLLNAAQQASLVEGLSARAHLILAELATPASRLELAETLPRFAMVAEQLRPAGLWHQLFADGQAAAFAVSELDASGSIQVMAVGNGPVVEELDAAIEWVDANVPNVQDVRLVYIPRMNAVVLWLQDDSGEKIVVVSDTDKLLGLAPRRVWSVPELHAACRSAR